MHIYARTLMVKGKGLPWSASKDFFRRAYRLPDNPVTGLLVQYLATDAPGIPQDPADCECLGCYIEKREAKWSSATGNKPYAAGESPRGLSQPADGLCAGFAETANYLLKVKHLTRLGIILSHHVCSSRRIRRTASLVAS